uniref:ARAD1D23914p n=1 Tax=Blastobotrys adeninivorans TaxID=409370 RepID=A0A060TGJ0_BLAAD
MSQAAPTRYHEQQAVAPVEIMAVQTLSLIKSSSPDVEGATTPRQRSKSVPNLHNDSPQEGQDGQEPQRPQIHECPDCGDRFLTTAQLRRHQKTSHDRKTFKCRKCGELFASIADRQTHKNNKHFSTIQCQVKNANFSGLDPNSTVSASRNESGYFSCPAEYCTFLTRIPQYWYDHIHHVVHDGTTNPQKRKRRQSLA